MSLVFAFGPPRDSEAASHGENTISKAYLVKIPTKINYGLRIFSFPPEPLRVPVGEVLSVSTPDAVSSTRRVSSTMYVHDQSGNQMFRPR
jgi:hypothetical protein